MKGLASFEELEVLGDAIIESYIHRTGKQDLPSVDIEGFLREDLKLQIHWDHFAENVPGRIAFFSDGSQPLWVYRNKQRTQVLFPKDTVVIDSYLKRTDERGRCRFSLAHEAAHKILEKHIPELSASHFKSEWESDTVYSLNDFRELLSMNETYANRLGAVLLMPRRLVFQALKEKCSLCKLPIYGYSVFDSKTKAVVRAMAHTLDVSYIALMNRLRELDLLEYRPIQEYIENQLGIGGSENGC